MRRPIGLWWMIGHGVVRIIGSAAKVGWYGVVDRLLGRGRGRRERRDRPPG